MVCFESRSHVAQAALKFTVAENGLEFLVLRSAGITDTYLNKL